MTEDRALFEVTEEQATTLLKAAEIGDSKAITALQDAVWEYYSMGGKEELSLGGLEIFNKFAVRNPATGEIEKLVYPYDYNSIHLGASYAKAFAHAVPRLWTTFTPAEKWGVATGVAGSATGIALAGILGLEVVDAIDGFDFP